LVICTSRLSRFGYAINVITVSRDNKISFLSAVMVVRCLFIFHSNVIQPPAEVRCAEKRSLESADRVIGKFRPAADAHALPCHCTRRSNAKVNAPLTTRDAMCSDEGYYRFTAAPIKGPYLPCTKCLRLRLFWVA
jgi:hypothetical protein